MARMLRGRGTRAVCACGLPRMSSVQHPPFRQLFLASCDCPPSGCPPSGGKREFAVLPWIAGGALPGGAGEVGGRVRLCAPTPPIDCRVQHLSAERGVRKKK